MGNNVTGGVRRILEKLRIELTIPVDDVMTWVGKQREIRRATLLFLLALDHFLGAFDIVGTDGKNLGRLFQMIVKQGFQLTQLSCTSTSPITTIKNQDDIFPTILRQLVHFAVLILQPEVGGHSARQHAIEIVRR